MITQKNNRKKFWKKIKSLRKNKNNKGENLNMDDLIEHFRNMLSGESDQMENQESHDDENNVNFDEDLWCTVRLKSLYF